MGGEKYLQKLFENLLFLFPQHMTQFERCKQKFKSILFFHSPILLVKHFGSTLCFWWCPFEKGDISLFFIRTFPPVFLLRCCTKNLPRIFLSFLLLLCCRSFLSFWAREKKKKPFFLNNQRGVFPKMTVFQGTGGKIQDNAPKPEEKKRLSVCAFILLFLFCSYWVAFPLYFYPYNHKDTGLWFSLFPTRQLFPFFFLFFLF